LKTAPPTVVFPVEQNIDQKFYVHPVDPCHAATLTPATVPFKSYFMGDLPMKINVERTQDSVSQDTSNIYLKDGTGYDLCGPRSYELYTASMSTPSFASIPIDSNPPVITV